MKVSKPFKFKQFTVEQDKCALKVNTDAVLLGALTDFADPANILEIGTGTGVISLMLAQRFRNAKVHGFEIEEQAFLQTRANFSNSPWADRLSVEHLPFQEFSPGQKYDLIVSNPPYVAEHEMETLQADVRLHEPHAALVAGPDGLDVVRRLIAEAPRNLAAEGRLLIEISPEQADAVRELLEPRGGYEEVRIIKDLAGRERVAMARRAH
jgi:HemK-like putative methylase